MNKECAPIKYHFDFKHDVCQWSLANLKRLGLADFDLANSEDALIYLLNYERHHIAPRPRQVFVAHDFKCPQKYVKGYDKTVEMIKRGMCLRPRGSRMFSSKRDKHAKKVDDLLLDWGIHHLHLGTEIDPKHPNLIKGGKDVMFVLFTGSEAYIIGVYDHHSWGKDEVIAVIKDNWPFLIEKNEIRGIVELTGPKPSANERQLLRKNCINSPVVIDDTAYWGRGGGKCAGNIGQQEVAKADEIYSAANALQLGFYSAFTYVSNKIDPKLHELNYCSVYFDVSRFVLSGSIAVLIPALNVRITLSDTQHLKCLVDPENGEFFDSEPTLHKIHNDQLKFGAIEKII